MLVLGATGTIGRAATRALVNRGHAVACLVRERPGAAGSLPAAELVRVLDGADVRFGEVTNPASLERDGFRGERFDVLVSCLASRTGVPRDAWAIDHQAHVHALAAAKVAAVSHVVLLSAICLQKPHLAYQHAKLAFERKLIESGLTYSIVRPTAYFKSLSGQVDRVRRGKPFVVFGDGTETSCKPISDADLANYLADCIDDTALHNRILPIGGPGPAITPLQQGEALFRLLDREPRFTHVPVRVLSTIASTLSVLGRVLPHLADKAELARIGLYYATESMLVLDAQTGRYDEHATPSYGRETLPAFYERLIKGETTAERGEHAVF